MSRSLLHVAAGIRISFLLKAESHSIAGMDLMLLVSSFISGHLGCFQLWLFANSTVGLPESQVRKVQGQGSSRVTQIPNACSKHLSIYK
jgi:hypothetical protein